MNIDKQTQQLAVNATLLALAIAGDSTGVFGDEDDKVSSQHMHDNLPPVGQMNSKAADKPTVVVLGATSVTSVLPQPQKAARRTKGLEPKKSEKKFVRLTVDSHKEMIIRATDHNIANGFSDFGGTVHACRYGVYKILEAETAGQPQAEMEPIRTAHRMRMVDVMAKRHSCDEQTANRLAKNWLTWTSAQLKLPREQQADERTAPGLTVAKKAETPSTPPAPKGPPPPPPKFTEEQVIALIAKTEDFVGQARWVVKKMADDGRYSTNERGALFTAIKAEFVSRAVKSGWDLADAKCAANVLVEPAREVRRPKPQPAKGAPVYKTPMREHSESHVSAEAAHVTTAKVLGESKPKPAKLTHSERMAKARIFATDLKAGAMKATTKTSEKKPDGKDKKKGKNKKAERAANAQANS